MSGAAVLRLLLIIAAVLPGVGVATVEGSDKTPPPAAQPPANPRMAVQAPDLWVTRVLVATLDASTNTYVPLPPEGVAAGQQFRLVCFFANRGGGTSGSFRVLHQIDGKTVGYSSPIAGLAHDAQGARDLPVTYATAGSHRYDCVLAFADPSPELVTENN